MIFISYSHLDAKSCQDLLTMAAPLTRYGGIQVFSDADIGAGASWASTIRKYLDKATVAVLLVSQHFLNSSFIMDVELPYVLKAREDRGLALLWVLVSPCLWEETPLQSIQAALPTAIALQEMPEAKRSAALKQFCQQIGRAWKSSETPTLNPELNGMKVSRKVENLKVLSRPATRRTEVFVRPDNTDDWYHQGPVLPGGVSRTCYFGTEKTQVGTGFHILALTTELAVPHQGGKPTKPLPKSRTRSESVRVVRA
jgi:hypothetical protein